MHGECTTERKEDARRELSPPVFEVRERLLVVPLYGDIDAARVRQVAETLLKTIRVRRAKAVVVDATGMSGIDAAGASEFLRAVEASRLTGAAVIVSGLSSEAAQTLVTLGADLSQLHATGDLSGGMEAAERRLGSPGRRIKGADAGKAMRGNVTVLRVEWHTQL